MASVKRSDLNQYYYNEGINWRKQTDDTKELMAIGEELCVSEGEEAKTAFQYGIVDEGLRIAMTTLAQSFIDSDLDLVEHFEVIITLSTACAQTISRIYAKRLLGL